MDPQLKQAAPHLPPMPTAAATRDGLPVAALDRWTGDPRFMQSLARGLLSLGAVARGGGHPVSARVIATQTGLSLAAAQRCLYTLHAIGYVRANRNGAVPGPALASLASEYAASSPLVSGCGPILDALREELGVSTSLAVFDGDQPLIVASSTSASLLKLGQPVGASTPVHCSSSGKVYLSALPDAELERRLARLDFKPYTPKTITSAAVLRKQVEIVRRQGFATADQELAIGIRTLAAPVRNGRGAVLGSINASMLSPSVGLRDMRSRIAPAVIRAAVTLSRLIP